MARIMGIVYRVKQTTQGQARPTMVAVKDGNKTVEHELETEDDELDFAKGQFPVAMRPIEANDQVSQFKAHQCRWRYLAPDEDTAMINPAHTRQVETNAGIVTQICVSVPAKFDGLQEGDCVAMGLGAGNKLAALLFIRGQRAGVTVFRTPPMYLQENRPDQNKDRDHYNLVVLLEQRPQLFYQMRLPDKQLILVAELLAMRQEAQQARIACGNRLIQSEIGKTFLEDEDSNLEGLIKDRIDSRMVNDKVYAALDEEEKRRTRELEKAVRETVVWQIFEAIEGVGPRIAAGIIAPIGDIRRFMVPVSRPEESPITDHERWRWEQYRDNGPGNTWYGKHLIELGITTLTLEQYTYRVRKSKAWNVSINKGAAKLMKYCGVHVMPDGTFPRRRTGEIANWSPDARQALYLLADQFNRKPNSVWGKKLLQYKAALREKHPEPIVAQKVLVSVFRRMETLFRGCGIAEAPEGNKVDSYKKFFSWLWNNLAALVTKMTGRPLNQDSHGFSEPKSIDQLYSWFDAQVSLLQEEQKQLLFDRIRSFEAELEKLERDAVAKAPTVGKKKAAGKNGSSTVQVYTAGHILKMAKWRTLTRFVRWMYKEWVKLENQSSQGADENQI